MIVPPSPGIRQHRSGSQHPILPIPRRKPGYRRRTAREPRNERPLFAAFFRTQQTWNIAGEVFFPIAFPSKGRPLRPERRVRRFSFRAKSRNEPVPYFLRPGRRGLPRRPERIRNRGNFNHLPPSGRTGVYAHGIIEGEVSRFENRALRVVVQHHVRSASTE